jgi:heat shock protein HtpX
VLPATGLRTHAWNTAIRSVLLLAGFPLLLVMMGYAVALFLVAGNARSVEEGLLDAARLLPAVIPVALLIAAIWFAIAWGAHNRILDFVTGARRIGDPRDSPRLWKLTEALCISRGMAMPRLAVIDTPARNAFASGLTPRSAGVTVTRGLMDALDDRELSAVIAHELSHIRNGDARLGVIAAVFVGVITLVTDMAWQSMRYGGGRRRRWRRRGGGRSSSRGGGRGNGGVVLVLIGIAVLIAVLAHLLALVLRMALSRNREYLADAGAVDMTQDADAMIAALRKVEQRPGMPKVPDQVRALFLHDAALSRAAGWFATHPPVEARIVALIRYAGGHDPGRLPELPDEAEKPATDAAEPPWQPGALPEPGRTPFQERLDAIAAVQRTGDRSFMEHVAKREAARREGRDPDQAAPAPPSGA